MRALELLRVRAGDRPIVGVEKRLAAEPSVRNGALDRGLDPPGRGLGDLDQRPVFGLELRDGLGDALPLVRTEILEGAMDAHRARRHHASR